MRGFIQEGCGLYRKYQTKQERVYNDKHSSLLRILVNCGYKMFYSIWPRTHKINTNGTEHFEKWDCFAPTPIRAFYFGQNFYQDLNFVHLMSFAEN